MHNKVELLAPAGNYESFLGAINAGADAIYLAGDKFGARAYANNFTLEELLRALDYAHIHNRKVYLTLNTLIKEREFNEIYSFLLPLYMNGLDGIIVQDLGIVKYIHECFKDLPIHISTQVSAANADAIMALKKAGAVRIVPARELSLSEIKYIIEKTNIEIETFIHGAICYCYSGQCLFSSILGQRSGNRGRCAQPCRLPYKTGEETGYLLSMKDMCTLTILPKLIQAGITSFKIEGRMKSSEYAAGVTAIYRKYIDMYYNNPNGRYIVDEQDLETLYNLYVRKDIQKGYYDVRNGRNMITISEPGYRKVSESLCEDIRSKYIQTELKKEIHAFADFTLNKPASLTLIDTETNMSYTAYGKNVEPAQKAPINLETIHKQLNKFGNTSFKVSDLSVTLSDNSFYGIKDLNELRRIASEGLLNTLLASYKREEVYDTLNASKIIVSKENETDNDSAYSILINTKEQLSIVLSYKEFTRIYLDYEFFIHNYDYVIKTCEKLKDTDIKLYIAMPHIMRNDKSDKYNELLNLIKSCNFINGLLIRDLGQTENRLFEKEELITDHNIYAFNRYAQSFICEKIANNFTLPYELNEHELKELNSKNAELIVYSHIPLMLSANCILKTTNRCMKVSQTTTLTDRQHKDMTVKTYCSQCYNIIYNSIPYSLHRKKDALRKINPKYFRIELLNEDKAETQNIIEAFLYNKEMISQKEYTNAHFNKGVQ